MSDVPDGMVTDARELYRGDLVYRKDHNAEVLLLRKQIWQLMGEVAEARDALNDPCGHSLHQWSMANGDCIRCGVRLELPKGWSYPK